MTIIDVAIPGVIGIVLFLWPQSIFIGSRVTPGTKEIRVLRVMGLVLVLISLLYLVTRFAGA